MSLEAKMKEMCRLAWDINKEYGVYVTAAMVKEQEDNEHKASSCTISKDGESYPDVWFYGNRKEDRYSIDTKEITEIEKGVAL